MMEMCSGEFAGEDLVFVPWAQTSAIVAQIALEIFPTEWKGFPDEYGRRLCMFPSLSLLPILLIL